MPRFLQDIWNAPWSTWWEFLQLVVLTVGLLFAGQQLAQTANSLRSNNGYAIYNDWSKIYADAYKNDAFNRYFVRDLTLIDPEITGSAEHHAALVLGHNYTVYEVVANSWAPAKAWDNEVIAICDLFRRKNFQAYYQRIRSSFSDGYRTKLETKCK